MLSFYQAASILVLVYTALYLLRLVRNRQENQSKDAIPFTKATLGARSYEVVAYPGTDVGDAARLLATLESGLRRLVDHVAAIPERDRYRYLMLPEPAKEAILNLRARFPASKQIKVDELNLTNSEVRKKRILAWTVEKTKGFRVCIRGNADSGQLSHPKDIFTTLVHELAHAARTEFEDVDAQGRSKHSDEFYAIYDFLIQEAIGLDLVHPTSRRRTVCAGMTAEL